MRFRTTMLATAILALVLAPGAGASWLIDRNASAIHLAVDNNGEALVSYRAQGRTFHFDSYNSKYGPGWHRKNSFVAHGPTSGMFCYGFYPYGSYPGYPAQRTVKINGHGTNYRIRMIGPGVTPEVMWVGNGLQDYDPHNQALVDWEQQMNRKLDQMRINYGETKCKQH